MPRSNIISCTLCQWPLYFYPRISQCFFFYLNRHCTAAPLLYSRSRLLHSSSGIWRIRSGLCWAVLTRWLSWARSVGWLLAVVPVRRWRRNVSSSDGRASAWRPPVLVAWGWMSCLIGVFVHRDGIRWRVVLMTMGGRFTPMDK